MSEVMTASLSLTEFVSVPFSQNRLSVPFWLAPLIQTPLKSFVFTSTRGRTHATHQNRLIQSRATSDDLQSPFDLNPLVFSPRSTGPETLRTGHEQDRPAYH